MCSLPFVVECCCKNEENRCSVLPRVRDAELHANTRIYTRVAKSRVYFVVSAHVHGTHVSRLNCSWCVA